MLYIKTGQYSFVSVRACNYKRIFDLRGIYLIKEPTEFQELQHQIADLENSYPIEFESGIKEIMKRVNNITYSTYNVSGKYYLKDIKEEEVQFR